MIEVRYADDRLAVVDKPAGLMVHDSKLARDEHDFLADRLREQFGRPLAAFQLIQAQIAEVAGNLAASAGMMLQVDALRQEGRMEMMHAAMAKATSTRLARSSAALARDALGGNGLLTEHEIAKIMGDVEAIYSYEGSYGMNTLIVGRALTGVSAFV